MSASATSPTTATHMDPSPISSATQPPTATAADPIYPNSYRHDPNRRTSFNFLRRQKSTDGTHKMLSKKNKGHQYPPQQAVPRVPPQLPTPMPIVNMNGASFIGENAQQQYTSSRYVTSPALSSPGSSAYTAASPLHQSSSPPSYGVPIPPIPSSSASYSRPGPSHLDDIDPYARTESMTHRGRYSYASSAISVTGINSPRRVRRRKDPTPFNILVIGAQNSGKTSFIDFLRSSLSAKNNGKREKTASPPPTAVSANSPFTPHYLETEVDQERIGVTLWDSQGLEKKFVDLQLREMSSFLESKFEDTFNEESKVVRAPGVRDTHIHCVFLILDPSRLDSNLAHSRRQNEKSQHARFDEPLRLMGILDEDLDVQVLKTLQGKTTVIPVISKADTITANHMGQLKRAVWDSLKQAKLDPLEALQFGDDDESDHDRLDERDEDAALNEAQFDGPGLETLSSGNEYSDDDANGEHGEHPSDSLPIARSRPQAHRRSPSGLSARLSQAAIDSSSNDAPYLPMSIISPDTYEPGVVGRKFPWGFADPYNSDHCDFVRLKDSVFSEWRGELREASREIWYEGWRTSRLNRLVGIPASALKATSGNGSNTHGRIRNVSGATSAKSISASNGPYKGGPVGHSIHVPPPGTAYSTSPPMSNGMQSPMSNGMQSSISTGMQSPMSHSPPGGAISIPAGGPEMVQGVYVQGIPKQ